MSKASLDIAKNANNISDSAKNMVNTAESGSSIVNKSVNEVKGNRKNGQSVIRFREGVGGPVGEDRGDRSRYQ